jgi:hypothetical protein
MLAQSIRLMSKSWLMASSPRTSPKSSRNSFAAGFCKRQEEEGQGHSTLPGVIGKELLKLKVKAELGAECVARTRSKTSSTRR